MPTENANLTTTELTSKQITRQQLEQDVAAFLAAGNKIKQCEIHESGYEDHYREFMTRNEDRIKEHMEKERAESSDT
jgi:hypothetical protein